MLLLRQMVTNHLPFLFSLESTWTKSLARIFHEYFSADLQKTHNIYGLNTILPVSFGPYFLSQRLDKKCQKIFMKHAG